MGRVARPSPSKGRDPRALTISYKAPIYDLDRPVAPGETRRPFTGSAAQLQEDIDTFARLGVTELIFDFRSETISQSVERMERFAEAVKLA